ncbi:Panacea domain-containing protein [Fusobacterium ulcerans]|uniref:Panacea domain-containing protein n=1 Tax=Fusobacterium ulcerans TaxID=861 RepID=UPI002E7628E1|nr:type II toxin-antitoxin system antitoxin SocA domain-containing protein [Fusobacterium ulcerans]MEE0136997.1 DUF4065 domain-containing protein [Fusobacterium ulcerans]
MYSIEQIADWFLTKEAMRPKKLQKICYYAQAWNLALKKKKLIDCDFEAWVHGPVCPKLYRKYKDFGWDLIAQKEVHEIKSEDLDILESVWETYGEYDGQQLEALTHEETPWLNARKGLGKWDSSNNKISSEDMQKFYLEQYIGD